MGGLVLVLRGQPGRSGQCSRAAAVALADGAALRRRSDPVAHCGRPAASGHGLLGKLDRRHHHRDGRGAGGRLAVGRWPGRGGQPPGQRSALGQRGGPAGGSDQRELRPDRLPADASGRVRLRRRRYLPRAAVRTCPARCAAGRSQGSCRAAAAGRRRAARLAVARLPADRLDAGDAVLRPARRLDRQRRAGESGADLAGRAPDPPRRTGRAGEQGRQAGLGRPADLDRLARPRYPAGASASPAERARRERDAAQHLAIAGRPDGHELLPAVGYGGCRVIGDGD